MVGTSVVVTIWSRWTGRARSRRCSLAALPECLLPCFLFCLVRKGNTMTQETTPQQNPVSDANQPMFVIEKLYLRDLSVEVPNAPGIFLEQGSEPGIDIQINHAGSHLQGDLFDAVLTVTVTAKLGEKTLFLVEVRQGGIFRLRNIPQAEVEPIMAIACPNILLPYVREAVSDAVIRAGFPPVYLQPINFEAVYRARLAEAQQLQQQANVDGAAPQG
jgi:preprotein translocase subunit SecB